MKLACELRRTKIEPSVAYGFKTVTPANLSIADLFAGAGGFSLGACRAGADLRVSVELDDVNDKTHSRNFPGTLHLKQDITKLTGTMLLSAIQQESLDGIIGGPPCQGFSEMGRRKVGDPRNELFLHFFRIVSEVKPIFFIAENVRGILHTQNRPIIEGALSKCPKRYEALEPLELCADDFGAATSRRRVFLSATTPTEWMLHKSLICMSAGPK